MFSQLKKNLIKILNIFCGSDNPEAQVLRLIYLFR